MNTAMVTAGTMVHRSHMLSTPAAKPKRNVLISAVNGVLACVCILIQPLALMIWCHYEQFEENPRACSFLCILTVKFMGHTLLLAASIALHSYRPTIHRAVAAFMLNAFVFAWWAVSTCTQDKILKNLVAISVQTLLFLILSWSTFSIVVLLTKPRYAPRVLALMPDESEASGQVHY